MPAPHDPAPTTAIDAPGGCGPRAAEDVPGGRAPASRRRRTVRARRGRDRRARVLLPAPGAPQITGPAPATAVVGGGVAGLAAATALAERGVRVTLYEREPVLGGRLAGWPTTLRDGTTVTMGRGSTPSSASTTTCAGCCAGPIRVWNG